MTHIICRHKNDQYHLFQTEGNMKPKGNAVRFSTLLDYQSDVEIPLFDRSNGKLTNERTIKLSELLRKNRKLNLIFDSIHRRDKSYSWNRFKKDRKVKFALMGVTE